MDRIQKRTLFLCSLGGVLEFYDFIIFALLASYIAKEFFPTGDNLTSLIAAFATFAVGYLVRPLGGILFGHFGDRYGRKTTFTLSILIMALSTLAIGFIPSFASIGISAPLLLSVLRVVQGMSIGGEIPGAIAYVSESIPKHKGLACGIIFSGLLLGIVFGNLALALLHSLLTLPQILAWGWRVPFIVGGIFGLISYQLRRKLQESSSFLAIADKVERYPALTVLRHYRFNLLQGLLMVGLIACVVSLLFLFMPAYLGEILKQPIHSFLWLQTIAMLCAAMLAIAFGASTDHFAHKKVLLLLCVLAMLFAYPIFAIYAYHYEIFFVALILSTILKGYTSGAIPSILSDFFPTKVRYSGIAISYNFGFAIFGGLTPFIATSLIYLSKNTIAPWYYLFFTAFAVSLITGVRR